MRDALMPSIPIRMGDAFIVQSIQVLALEPAEGEEQPHCAIEIEDANGGRHHFILPVALLSKVGAQLARASMIALSATQS
jgi:hypothetical protein